LVAEPLNEMFLFLDMLHGLCCSKVKKINASPEKSKWLLYTRWRRKCLYFSPNNFKIVIFVHFSFVFFNILGKIKLLWKYYFLKIQNGGIIEYEI
jgi:hypothetical protein